MLYAKFVNFTTKPFTAHWNGKPYTFKPGQSRDHLPDGVAQVFAKHLANQILTESDRATYCSPKKPTEVPQFMELFNKAYFPEGTDQDLDPDMGVESDVKPSMNVEIKQRQKIDPYDASANPVTGPGNAPQIIGTNDGDGDESEYEAPESKSEDIDV